MKPCYMLENAKADGNYLGEIPTDKTMRNQQATLEPTDLAWLAGFIDGEGTIGMIKRRVYAKGKYQYDARFSVANTNEAVMLHVISIIRSLGVEPYIVEKSPAKEHHKPAIQVDIRRMAKVRKVLEAIAPYLVCKKANAEILLSFIDRRLSNTARGQRNPYSEADIKALNDLSKLNQRGVLRDYTQGSEIKTGDDIVRPIPKGMEAAEMPARREVA